MIDLPVGRIGTVVYVAPDHAMIIVEVGSEVIDYTIEKNSLKEISRMTVGPEELLSRLIEDRRGAEAADVRK